MSDQPTAKASEEEKWPTSAETEAVAWPINVMDGAEWNILDSTGARIAICGFDVDTKTDEFRRTSKRIAWAIVGMLRNLKCKNEVLEEQLSSLSREHRKLMRVVEAAKPYLHEYADWVDKENVGKVYENEPRKVLAALASLSPGAERRGEETICAGCQRPELHKMCPAWGTPFYMSGVPFTPEIEALFKSQAAGGAL